MAVGRTTKRILFLGNRRSFVTAEVITMGVSGPRLECPICREKWRIGAELHCVDDRPVGFVHRCHTCGSEWTDEGFLPEN